MQNKPNLPDNQMNVNNVLTKEYKNSRFRRNAENKPNQSQILRQRTEGYLIDYFLFSIFYLGE